MSDGRIPALVREAVTVLPLDRRPEDLEDLLCGYLAHLLDRNVEINLVSRKNTFDHVLRFTRECLFLAAILQEERSNLRLHETPRLLDIGSGGGFPGMVLKIAIPELELQMVEATGKKAKFLADVAAGLDLRGTSVLWGRAEQLAEATGAGSKALRHRFDWVTGKGLGKLRDSTALSEPFLAPGGVHWTFKGKACQEEIEAAGGFFRQRGFAPHRVVAIPGSETSWVVGVKRLRRG